MLIATAELAPWFVVCMGLGTVFVGLIAIIIIITITSKIINLLVKDSPSAPVQKASNTPAKAASQGADEIPNRQEFVAAVAACIAEDLGTDISKIQILSIKKL